MHKIICILGKSGSGKSYLFNKILENKDLMRKFNLTSIQTITTRPPRKNIENEEYNYVLKDTFLDMANNDEFASHTEYLTEYGIWYYGHKKIDLEKSNKNIIIIVSVQELAQLKERYGDKIYVIYINKDPEERIIKLLEREDGLSNQEKLRRIKSEKEDFNYYLQDIKINYYCKSNINLSVLLNSIFNK